MQGKNQKRRIRILVKAFPQPSTKHEETVCCAGVTEDGQALLRLYALHSCALYASIRYGREPWDAQPVQAHPTLTGTNTIVSFPKISMTFTATV